MFPLLEKNRKGFSIMELVFTMAILSIIAAIAIPRYVTYSRQSQIARAQAELRELNDAIELLASDTGLHPSLRANDLVHESPCVSKNDEIALDNCAAGLLCTDGKYKNWKGPYVDKDMLVDPWGTKYWFDPDYTCHPNIKGCEGVENNKIVRAIVSFGPNKKSLNQYDKDDVIRIICVPR